ncbi:hypothetical protein Tco_0501937 [Tanacetum coccineum]
MTTALSIENGSLFEGERLSNIFFLKSACDKGKGSICANISSSRFKCDSWLFMEADWFIRELMIECQKAAGDLFRMDIGQIENVFKEVVDAEAAVSTACNNCESTTNNKQFLTQQSAVTIRWDDIQAKIDDDHQLAERLQAQEQEELSDAENATLFQQLLERRKHFVPAKRVKEKRKHTTKEKLNRKKRNLSKGEDLEDLYKLVKAKFKSTNPVEDLDLLLWGDLKTMFEPHKLDDFEEEYQVEGSIVGIKSLLDDVWITVAYVFVNAAQMDLVLAHENF